jgi:hypothetical protein
MKQKSGPGKAPADQVLKDIRRQTRRHYSAEEKIRIVLEGLRGEENISGRVGYPCALALRDIARNAAMPTANRRICRR